jgi:type II secretion system protein C
MLSTTKRPDLRRWALAGGGLAPAGLLALLMLREPGTVPTPAPLPPLPPPPIAPAPVQPSIPAPNADGLRLFGLLGRGAVIGLADGRQSFFAIGREIRPGLKVARIEQNHVVLASDGGEVRLGFDGARPPEAPASAAAPAVASAGSRRDKALAYRFGLAPRRANGRITGYAVRPGANLPLLQRAGLRPGDVIVSVNGQHFDSDEKVLELPNEIAGSFTAEFEFERGGRRMRASLDVNPRT